MCAGNTPKLMVLGLGLSQLQEWIRANRVRYGSAAMTQDKQTAASQKGSAGVAEFRAYDERLYPPPIMSIQKNGYLALRKSSRWLLFLQVDGMLKRALARLRPTCRTYSRPVLLD